MKKRGVNAPQGTVPERVQWAVDLLDVRPDDHLLEIGCGTGHAISLVCTRLVTGTITGIDRSPAMVARARARNATCFATGRARILQQSLVDADLNRRFLKIFAINVNAFWTAPAPSIQALGRLLAPRGMACLVYEPPTVAKLRELAERLPDRMADHGFAISSMKERKFPASHGLCIVGRPA